jgi:hypothetical protein
VPIDARALGQGLRDHVASEVVARVGAARVLAQAIIECVGVECVDAHAHEGTRRVLRERSRVGWLLDELEHPAIGGNAHHPEGGR